MSTKALQRGDFVSMLAWLTDPYFKNLKLPRNLRVWTALCIAVIPNLILAVVIFQPWVAPKWMFFDALTAAEFSSDCCHIYYGFVSNLGIFLWIATAAISLFAALIFYLNPKMKPFFWFALSAGLLSAWLGLDDGFLLHEVAFPELGVPQLLVLAIYVVLAVIYGLMSLKVILSSEYWILALAAIGVGASLGLDTLLHSIEDTIVIAEDSAKFFGIFCWFVFHTVTLARIFTQSETGFAIPAQDSK